MEVGGVFATPLRGGILVIEVVGAVVPVAHAYLTVAGDFHIGVVQHLAVLAAAVGRGGDEGVAANLKVGAVDDGEFVGFGIADGVGDASAAAEDVSVVILVGVGRRHDGLVDNAHLAVAINDHLGQTGPGLAGLGLAHDMERVASGIEFREGTHGTQLAAAIDGALHEAARHGDRSVAFHPAGLLGRNQDVARAVLDVGSRTLAAAIDRAYGGTAVVIHFGVQCHFAQLAAAIDASAYAHLRHEAAAQKQHQSQNIYILVSHIRNMFYHSAIHIHYSVTMVTLELPLTSPL